MHPVLFDAAMHLMGAWHLEQPDWSGRILLPIGMNLLEFFGPPPEVGTWLDLRAHNEEETARQVRHGLEAFRPDGSIWLRLTGAGYWRFYLPFGHVNFFGPKDERWAHLPDANHWWERVPMAALVVVIIGVGIYPAVVVDFLDTGIINIVGALGG